MSFSETQLAGVKRHASTPPAHVAEALLSAALMAFCCLKPAPAAAQQWGPLGVPVCGDSCRDISFRAIADGVGGAFVTWSDYRYLYETGTDAFAQRITAAGTVAPGWPACGLPVSVLPNSQAPGDPFRGTVREVC